MQNTIARTLTLAAVTVALAGVSGHVLADTPTPAAGHAVTPATKFQATHPRRAQVNSRLNKQQAAALHSEDHQIRTEERDMASQNNTHITTQEQKTLNQQENAVSGQIGPQK